MAPTAFCRKVRRSRRSAFSPTTSTPPTMSEWPFRYLVAECMTMSKPCSIGRCTQGLAKVLSQTVMMPRLRAAAASAERSTSFSSGLVGVSTQSMRVSGRIAASKAAVSVRSTKLKASLAERSRTRSKSRRLPP